MNNKKHILSPKERRMIYIEYLKENNGASTSEFQAYLRENYNVEISRGTLSEDRKHLEKMNYKFATRNGKYILTEESSDVQNFSYKETQKFTSCIDKDLFLDWLLLYEGREKANSFGKSDLADNDGVLKDIKPRIIQEHLFQLSQEGYLIFERTNNSERKYEFRSSVPAVYSFSAGALSDFCYNYENAASSIGSAASTIKPIYQFCTLLQNNELLETNDSPSSNADHFLHGRQNSFPDNINSQLKSLNKLPYEDKQLNLVFSSPKLAEKQQFLFSVGILFYSTETNQCYLLGKSEKQEILLVRLDHIDFKATTASDVPNSISDTEKITLNQIYAEMFSAALDDPEEVEIHFDAYSKNIESKVNALHKYRSTTSRITQDFIDDKKTLIYTDTIRGLSSFAHYLRTFGYGAKVIRPQKLRDMLLTSAQQVFNNYSEPDTI